METTLTSSADSFLRGFAQTWHDEQERRWGESSQDNLASHFAALEQSWQAACEQWWINLRHVVPDPLAGQVEAALRQSQLCVRMALRGERISAADLERMVSPAAGLRAAIQAQQRHDVGPASCVAPAQLLANQAMLGHMAKITERALKAARERLRTNHQCTPREIYSQCAHIMEKLYREQAGNDEFAQLVGQWVNAHVDVLAARRRAAAKSSDHATNDSAERTNLAYTTTPPDAGHAISAVASTAPVAQSDPLSDRVVQQMRIFSDKLAAGAASLAALRVESSLDTTASEVVFQCEGAKLRRYRGASQPSVTSPALPPLLLVYSLVNRPYILDLNEDRSLVRALCDAGRDVYLLDWGYPSEKDTALSLDDYVNRYLHGCVTYLQEVSDADTVDIIGICQGGPFALCYTALEPTRVRRLALMAAPTDFHGEDFLLARWMRHIDVDTLVSALGNVPGHLLNWSFIALKPVSLSGLKALELLDLLDRPRELATYAQVERWLQDSPDQAGQAFAEFTQTFVRENALVNASARIGSRIVDLRAIRHKVLNIFATRDHIVPPSASRSLPALLSNAQCTNQQVDCGHIGVFAGRRTQSEVPNIVNGWFKQAD